MRRSEDSLRRQGAGLWKVFDGKKVLDGESVAGGLGTSALFSPKLRKDKADGGEPRGEDKEQDPCPKCKRSPSYHRNPGEYILRRVKRAPQQEHGGCEEGKPCTHEKST
jgi:hypothetical protein